MRFQIIICAFLALANLPFNSYAQAVKPITMKDGRYFGIDVSNVPENGNFDTSFNEARTTGLQVVKLAVNWNDYETQNEKIKIILANSDAYYSQQGVKVDLVIKPVDTNGLHLPPQLQGKTLGNPIVTERFKNVVAAIVGALPNVTFHSIIIGNEIDSAFGEKEKLYVDYTAFLNDVIPYVKSLKPGIPIGTSATYEGLVGKASTYMQDINKLADAVFVNYYPLNSDFTVQDPAIITETMDKLVKLYPQKKIYFSELGYPSSDKIGSSEDKQSEFIRSTFVAWDKYAQNIPYICFSWLNDLSPDSVKSMYSYYKLDNKNFGEFLGTIGLRTWEGQGRNKKALAQLKSEVASRK